MTLEEMAKLFGAAPEDGDSYDENDEYLHFERIVSPRNRRPDICAFLMLDELVPGDRDIVTAAEHDEIFLGVDPEALAAVATPEVIRDLRRCGVRYDARNDCLAMFA